MSPHVENTYLKAPTGPESRFTPASPHCPHPERWSSTDSDSTEVEVSEFVGSLVRALQPDLVIETGTAWGQTAEQIGMALSVNGRGKLVSLEIDAERCASSELRCAGLPVSVVHGSSLDHPFEPGRAAQFVWFDSLFHLRAREFRHYYSLGLLPPGTMVGFHDTGPQHPVRADLERLVDRGLLRLVFLPTPRGLALGEVL